MNNPTSEEISNLCLKIVDFNNEDIVNRALENAWMMESEELSLKDSLVDLRSIAETLLAAYNEGIIDSLSYEARKTLKDILLNLHHNSVEIINGTDHTHNVMRQVDNLKEKVRLYSIEFELERYPGYAKKRQDLNYLNQRYKKLITEVDRAEEISNLINTKLDEANNLKTHLEAHRKESEESKQNIQVLEKSLTEKSTLIETSYTKAEQNQSTINSIKGEIEEFHGKIESNKTDLIKLNSESTKLIQRHKELEAQITNLLQKATANNLFQAFRLRADSLQSRINNWTWGIILSVTVLILLGAWIASQFADDGPNYLFVFKLFLTSPVVYALLFFSKQFGNDRKLQEEYSFKSTISLSIVPFKEELLQIAKQSEGREENVKIMERTMQQVFSSPIENISKNPVVSNDDILDPYKLIETLVKAIKK